MKNLITKIINRTAALDGNFPTKKDAITFIETLFETLYTSEKEREQSGSAITTRFDALELLFPKLLASGPSQPTWNEFYYQLNFIYEKSITDATNLFNNDPAATSLNEVLNTYPGFYATAVYRISHFFWLANQKELARFFSEYVHSKTGIDIHPGATIGEGFAIDHGTGIVIGETSVIGKNVKIYQGVTLGAFNVSKESSFKKRHPTIQDNVVIYSNATILGGNTVVGKDSIIGGNVWLTQSVPSNSVAFHQMEIKVKDNNPFPEPINFII